MAHNQHPMHALSGPVFRKDPERLADYREARDFVDGYQWIGRPRRGETRLTYNYARRILQAAVAYMFPLPVQFNVPASEETDEGSAAAALAERTLADYLGHIGADDLDYQLAFDASLSGDAAVKVTWDPVALLPIVTPVDPAHLIVTTRPDRPKVPIQWEHHYAMTPDEMRAALPAAADRLNASHIAGSTSRLGVAETWTDDRWVLTFAGEVLIDGANPYGWMPYVALVNNPLATEFWGSSDLVDLYDVCRQLNGRMSVVSDVLTLSGYPIAVLENVDGGESINVGPGAKWEIPEGAKAYLLDLLSGGGVRLHIDYIGETRRTMYDLGETPKTAFGDTGRAISGAALEVEIQPLVQKVRRKRRGFDAFYRERNTRLLDLAERFGGVALGGIRRAIAVWPSILPNDDDAKALRLTQMSAADNLSHRSAMATWGIEDPEGEWARVIEEKTAVVATEPKEEGVGDDDSTKRGDKAPAKEAGE